MNNQLIPVVSRPVGTATIPTINARELHAFLEVGKDFSSWIKDQIARARLVENRDFVINTEKGEYKKPRIEYHLTIEAGKHIGMMSGTDKGFDVRDYFIECERLAKDPMALLNDPTTMRGLLLGYTEKVLELQAENAVLAPKAAISDLIAASNDLFGFRQAAKILNISENKFRIYLIESGWIYYLSKRLTGTAKAIKKGYLDVRMKTLPHAVGDEPKIVTEMYFTAKGVHRLAEIFHITPTFSGR